MNNEQVEWKLYFGRLLFGNFAAVSHVDHSTHKSLSEYDDHQSALGPGYTAAESHSHLGIVQTGIRLY